jgi:hypothetical protein
MLGEVLNVGEKVTIQVSKDSQDWGYNPAPNGTVVEIVSFGEIEYGYTNNFGNEPGVYTNHCWANVRLPNQSVIHISTCHLDVCSKSYDGIDIKEIDIKEYDRRVAAYHDSYKKTGKWEDKNRLRDLPETRLWVGDSITDKGMPEYDRLYVAGINYHYIGQKRDDGSDMPLYEVSNTWPSGWRSASDDKDLTLIERGNVWKYYHKEPMSFSNLEEEARFYSAIGRTRQVRCPTTGNYRWENKEQVLDAIQNGTVHALSLEGGLFGSSMFDTAYIYLDEEVGKRVAAHTLKGFGR